MENKNEMDLNTLEFVSGGTGDSGEGQGTGGSGNIPQVNLPSPAELEAMKNRYLYTPQHCNTCKGSHAPIDPCSN